MKELKRKFIQAARAQTKSTSESIRDFIVNETRINGAAYSTKDHEYQEMIINLHLDPDVDFVLSKVSQAGASEVIYRIKLAYSYLVPGYYSALILPSLGQVSEVMKVRVAGIIQESPALRKLVDPKIDSASLKRLINGSILYALSGSGTSKSTAITRPIRDITVDELARVDMKTVTSMTSRQRKQSHKSTSYFSTPIYEGFDISAEIELCGKVMEEILICDRCNHEFFPDFYTNVKIPNYSGALEVLSIKKIAEKSINVQEAYLECPKCHRKIPYGFPYTKWIDTAENPNLPKVGMKIGPFDMPRFVSPYDMIRDMITNQDRNEFEQQTLGIPTSAKNSALDLSQLVFENALPGVFNVMGVDVGKYLWITIGSVVEGQLYIHTIKKVPLKDARVEIPRLHMEYRSRATVIDMLPNQELSVHLCNTIPNTWVAIYATYKVPRPELFTLKVKDDEALGVVRQATINQNPMFDHFAYMISQGQITYRSSSMDSVILEHLKVMRRVRDAKLSTQENNVYKWVKPNKLESVTGVSIDDHIHHSSVYCTTAAKLMLKSEFALALPIDISKIKTS